MNVNVSILFFLNAVYLQRNYICNGNKEDS